MPTRDEQKAAEYLKTLLNEKTSHKRSVHDTLFKSASVHYFDKKVFSDVCGNIGVGAANILARQVAIFNAKKHQWNRRTYTRDYCNRSECGSYAYMNDGMFTGRMEPKVDEVYSVGGDWYERVEALTIQIPHRGERLECIDDSGDHGSFLAAIRTVDCDGITIDVSEVYESREDAKRAANGMAERECEVICESNEKYAVEVRTEEINEQLVELRRDVVKLIKSIKPIRCDMPSAIVMCVMDKISEMLSERRGLFRERNEMPDFN